MRETIQPSGSGLLTESLFASSERWGWEYVFEGPPRPSPLLNSEPRWQEPTALSKGHVAMRVRAAHNHSELYGKIGAVLAVIGFLAFLTGGRVGGAVMLLLACLFALLYFKPVIEASARAREEVATWRRTREEGWKAYRAAHRTWKDAVRQHDDDERYRYEVGTMWCPLQPEQPPPRVDVFGGLLDGWAALVTTMGTSLLGSGSDLLVLDLTGQDVSAELRVLASEQGRRVEHVAALDETALLDPLGRLTTDEAVDVLARTVHGGRGDDAEASDLLALDSELLERVVVCLDDSPTLERIVAGLAALSARAADGPDSPLSVDEQNRLRHELDAVEDNPDLKRRLTVVLARLRPLRDVGSGITIDGTATVRPSFLEGRSAGLAVVTVDDRGDRRVESMQCLLFHATTLGLGRNSAHPLGRRVFVVAGADRLGRDSLEAASLRARRAGVRLVYMFSHLRESVVDLLGGQGSTSLLMQLGSSSEASAAADFVGRQHKYVLSQLTHSVGETITEGSGTTETWQEGESETFTQTKGRSKTRGAGLMPNVTKSRSVSESLSTSRSHSWAETRNISESLSSQEGETVARSYEYSIEPTTFQSLPPTAFIAVMRFGENRHVVAADCNPGILQLDRVSPVPLPR